MIKDIVKLKELEEVNFIIENWFRKITYTGLAESGGLREVTDDSGMTTVMADMRVSGGLQKKIQSTFCAQILMVILWGILVLILLCDFMLMVGGLIGMFSAGAIEIYLDRKYGYGLLSILHALCYNSKHFRWMSYCIWGDLDWFYENVLKALGKR